MGQVLNNWQNFTILPNYFSTAVDHLIAHKDRQMARVLQRRSYFLKYTAEYIISHLFHILLLHKTLFIIVILLIFRSNYMTVICLNFKGAALSFRFWIMPNLFMLSCGLLSHVTVLKTINIMVSTQSLTYLWRGVSLRRTGCLTTFKCVRGSGIKGRNKSPKTINQVRTIFLLCRTVLMVHGHVTKTTFLD